MLKNLRNDLLKYFDWIVVCLFLIFALIISIFNINIMTNFLSYFFTITFVLMILGNILVLTNFSQAFPLYIFSFSATIFLSVLFWIVKHKAYYDYYALIVILLVIVPFVSHLLTRKRNAPVPFIPLYSLFLLAVLIVLSTTGLTTNEMMTSSLDSIFFLSLAFFAATSVFCLNIAYRIMILNRQLKIRNRTEHLREVKEKLENKFKDTERRKDIDLITYFYSSSLESFVYGNFERSFMDAYKIVFDSQGTAFKKIYQLPENRERKNKYDEIRNCLSHAHVSTKKKDKTEETADLKKLGIINKNLFSNTLELLRIVKFEFINEALKDEQL